MNHYHKHVNQSSSRLLSLVNTSSFSSSYGCFDKSYWHFKTSDFPNAAKQQAILSLAKLYLFKNEENDLFGCPKVLSIIEGSIHFCQSIQHKDGSFDEWYVNERGWAGPTGYLIYALTETYALLKSDLSKETLEILEDIFSKSKEHLILSDEKHPLANHIAIAMLAIFNLSTIDNDPRLLSRYDQLLTQLESLFHNDEGWSVEYDGADPGYQSATVSFLSRIHKINNCSRIETICLKSLEFIKYFCYPDGSFAGSIGSRHTTNIFYFGVEYWNNIKNDSISPWIKTNFHKHTLPNDHGDNYFIYRVHELFDAGEAFADTKSPLLSYQSKVLANAGIEIVSDSKHYIVLNRNRGFVFKCFSHESNELIAADNGVLIKSENKTYTNLWMNHSGLYFEIKEKYFTPLTFILFRAFFLLFSRNRKIAYYLKNSIKQVLIFGKKEAPFKEINSFNYDESTITINKNITSKSKHKFVAIFGDVFYSRYVPQSSLFNSKALSHLFETTEEFSCSQDASFEIKYNLKNGTVKREIIS